MLLAPRVLQGATGGVPSPEGVPSLGAPTLVPSWSGALLASSLLCWWKRHVQPSLSFLPRLAPINSISLPGAQPYMRQMKYLQIISN